jgi:hypothetical protein
MTPVVAAVRVMAGGASTADVDHLKAQVDASLTGSKCPLYQGGYTMQHDLNVTAMLGVVRNIPSIWSDHLTSAQRNRATALMNSAVLIGAWCSSDKQGTSNIYELPGYSGRAFKRNWNPNYRLAFIGQILAAIPFFGSATAVQNYLDGFTTSALNSHVSTLNSLGLTNNYKTFNAIGSGGNSPSKSTFVDKVTAYRYYSRKLSDSNAIFNIVKGEADDMWSRPVSFGARGTGVLYNGVRRGWVVNESGNPPNKGDIAMAKELDASDADGPRSAMSYALDGARCEINYIAALAATGYLSRDMSGMSTFMTRMGKGWNDLQDKTDRGFLSYSKGMKGPGGRENWTGTYPDSTYLFSVAKAFYDEFVEKLLR